MIIDGKIIQKEILKNNLYLQIEVFDGRTDADNCTYQRYDGINAGIIKNGTGRKGNVVVKIKLENEIKDKYVKEE